MRFLLDAAAEGATGGGSGIVTIVMLVAMIAIFYFFMYRPQKKQDKQQNEMRNSIEVGDEITTIGGIIGKIVSIKEETLVIETTKDKTKIRILRTAIRSVDVKAEDSQG
ncbi:MAG: preprotein translocase subunit YajC [Ruminococcaceae bacterium]|nr:preprotein translocase subunit YajC [Oscillospiraceae bacterium]